MKVKVRADGVANGPINMALDSQLMESAARGSGVCRSYRWDGAWVSLGRFQKGSEAVTPGFSRYVVRPTGGKAVLHGHDQTVALALPFRGRSVKEAYRIAVTPLVGALNLCGLDCRLASDQSATSDPSPDCFASSSPYDLVHGTTGEKIAGVAMAINRSALLLQMSIPYQAPLVAPKSAILYPAPNRFVAWEWGRLPEALRQVFGEMV